MNFGFYWCEKIKDAAPEERKIQEFNLCYEMDDNLKESYFTSLKEREEEGTYWCDEILNSLGSSRQALLEYRACMETEINDRFSLYE
jgi:hypothetical protein